MGVRDAGLDADRGAAAAWPDRPVPAISRQNNPPASAHAAWTHRARSRWAGTQARHSSGCRFREMRYFNDLVRPAVSHCRATKHGPGVSRLGRQNSRLAGMAVGASQESAHSFIHSRRKSLPWQRSVRCGSAISRSVSVSIASSSAASSFAPGQPGRQRRQHADGDHPRPLEEGAPAPEPAAVGRHRHHRQRRSPAAMRDDAGLVGDALAAARRACPRGRSPPAGRPPPAACRPRSMPRSAAPPPSRSTGIIRALRREPAIDRDAQQFLLQDIGGVRQQAEPDDGVEGRLVLRRDHARRRAAGAPARAIRPACRR